MSGAESFISRWARRKRESERERLSEPSPGPSDADVKPVGGDGETPAAAEASEPAPAAFDPASLPPIESISGSTDIRSFLLSGVPAELTQAALRRAWATDPAICDFIGIAENQWDFTDPTAIPGFGPLTAADEIPDLAGQMLGRTDDSFGQIAEASFAGPSEDAGSSVPASPESADIVAKGGPAGAEIVSPAEEHAKAADAAVDHSTAADCDTPRGPPSHGGALPR
jgi:hypothetical protein